MFIRRSKYENIILEAFKRGRKSNILTDDIEAVRNFATEMKFKKKVFPELEVFGGPGRNKTFSIIYQSGIGMTASMVIPKLQESNMEEYKNPNEKGNDMSKSIINFELFKSILHEFFTENLVDKILDYMNENHVLIKNFEDSEDDIWFSAKKLLPEDKEIYEVIAELPSNGRLFKEFGFYDQEANEWYKYSGERTIHVVAWKKMYE